MNDNNEELAGLIDHTLLRPETTVADIRQLVREAQEHSFHSVCVAPIYVSLAAELLQDSELGVCTVIAFPLGATETQIKIIATDVAVEQGADEIDMVINIGALKSGQLDLVKSDIAAVVDAARGRPIKAILETCLLSDDEKVAACRLALAAGAGFVKTSTGFSHGGATPEDVRLLRETVGSAMGVKASGGINDYQSACAMVEAGASRLGTSAGMSIIGAAKTGGDRQDARD